MKKTVAICFIWNNFENRSKWCCSYFILIRFTRIFRRFISKISLPKQSSNWLSVRVDLLLTLINLWLSSDIDLSILFLYEIYSDFQSAVINFDYCFKINEYFVRLHNFQFHMFSFSTYFGWFLSAHFTKLRSNSSLYNPAKF